MRVAALVICLVTLLLGSCSWALLTEIQSGQEHDERQPRLYGLPRAQNCSQHNSIGSTPDHRKWAECMGVEYK